MAPKRKAPPSSSSKPKPSGGGGGSKPSHPAGSKRPALSNKQLKYRPPPVKKARVEVEYEESAPTKGGKKSQATGGGGGGKPKEEGGKPKGDKAGETNGRPLKKKEIERLKAEAAEKKALKALGGATTTNTKEVATPTVPLTSTLKSSSSKPAPSTKKLAFADDQPATTLPSPSTSTTTQPKKSTTPRALLPPKTFQIITGSYEKLLYGLSGTFPLPSTPVAERDYTIKPIFIFPAHQACVKAVAASEGGKWLATGSTDEVVKIWDLRRRKEVGGLVQHSG